MPLEFEPGEEAQVDWHEGWIFENGVERTCQFFVMRLCYSKATFVYPYEKADLASFLDGHVRAFSADAVLNVLRNEPLTPRRRLDLSDRPELTPQDSGIRDVRVYDQLRSREEVLV